MKTGIVLCAIAAMLSVPARGSENIHGKRQHAVLLRKPKANFIFRAYPDLRAKPGVSLELQNMAALAYHLPRALTEKDYEGMVEKGQLVPAPKRIDCMIVDPRLAPSLTMLAPDALRYIVDELAPLLCEGATITGAHGTIHKPLLVISSLTRTLEYQRILARRNPNARGALGDDNPLHRSVHSTGFAVDLSVRNLSHEQSSRIAHILDEQQGSGKKLVIATFEVEQNHFHVMIRPSAPIAP